MPVGPGASSVHLDLWAPAPSSARWDRAAWDGGHWGTPAWNAIGCDVTEAVYTYGVTEEAGILSVPSAGQCDLTTRDPDRTLDPSNPDGPYFGYVGPGSPIRIRSAAGQPAWIGYLDEAAYGVGSARGRLRAVDGVAYLAQADVPEGTALPNTLRARVRAVIAAVGLSTIVPVEPEPPATVQLLTNTGYEDGYTGWTADPGCGWDPEAGGGTDPAGAYHANVYALTAGTNYPGLHAAGSVPVTAGGSYVLQGWGRVVGAARDRAARVEWYDWSGTLLSINEVAYAGASGATWTWHADTFTAPPDAVTARVWLFTYATAVPALDSFAQWDDVLLTGPYPNPAPPDPPVAAYDGKAHPAWSVILDAAQDALYLPWLDAAGTLHLASWGGFPDAPFALGCGPTGEGPWIVGLRTIDYAASASPIRNQVRAWSAPSVNTATVSDPPSVTRYGGRLFAADRVVPDFATWSGRILADRAGAGLSVDVGEVRPYSSAELAQLLSLGTGGPQAMRVRDEDHPPVIDQVVSAIGATVRVTAAGWSFGLVTMIPRVEWEAVEPEPPEPPIPPPDPWHTETRSYLATSDALLALTSGGSKYGAGAATTLPVGAWSGWTYRSCIKFASIPWTKVRAVRSATLRLDTSDQVRLGFGASPTIEVRRITGSWSAGSSSSPSSGNAVVYPGPATTSSGAKRANVTDSEDAAVSIDITAIARAWAPASAGGSAAAQQGVMLLPGSGSQADTTEFWPVEKGGSRRPQIDLDLEVFD